MIFYSPFLYSHFYFLFYFLLWGEIVVTARFAPLTNKTNALLIVTPTRARAWSRANPPIVVLCRSS